VPEFKAAGGFEPEEYMEYFEDSNPSPNAEIGCKMPFPDGHYLLEGLHSGQASIQPVGLYRAINALKGYNVRLYDQCQVC
jgi:hypothetical protein